MEPKDKIEAVRKTRTQFCGSLPKERQGMRPYVVATYWDAYTMRTYVHYIDPERVVIGEMARIIPPEVGSTATHREVLAPLYPERVTPDTTRRAADRKQTAAEWASEKARELETV